ncbi:hypothetical protein ACN6LM_001659 [Streptomyces sp. SAS_281]|uniref:hypothetical protein n=1 Tax=Streptomyces sp. SAS_281 TaxID=3412744 RepID=UPI00403C6E66
MARSLDGVLDPLPRPRSATGRVPVTGWFSLPDGEVTAGGFLAQRAVSDALGRSGVPHDSAWSPHSAPGALPLEAARPGRYEQVLFVCGPVHGGQLTRLHERYAPCRRTAVGVSVVDGGSPAVLGFDRIAARDRDGKGLLADLALSARTVPDKPVVGVALTHGQGEYARRREHDRVAETLYGRLPTKDCAPAVAETRPAHGDWRGSAGPAASSSPCWAGSTSWSRTACTAWSWR